MTPNPPDAAPHVFDATTATFERDVLQASLEQPVLVDFWAEWCGPCKTLGPLLEKVVASFNGAMRLAKVDVDKEQQLAAMFGVRSIPTVVLLKDGQIADGFAGALSEGQLREFLLRHVQPLEADAQPAGAQDAIEETPAEAITRLRAAIATEPERAEWKLDLAVALMQDGQAAAAEAELDALPANLAADERAKRLRNQLELADLLKDAPPLAELRARIERDPSDLAARDLLGVRLIVGGDSEAGLDALLANLAADRHWNDGLAKKRLIAAFGVIDDADLVGRYRRRMSSLLF
ncbi:MAG: thioredoxin [Xanthomonadales bacterium]|nr:thioredoxin [Xanthomonadales bacterium]